MQIQITSDNLEVSASMKTLAEQKLPRLQNLINENTPEDLTEVRVVMNKGSKDGTFETKVEFIQAGLKVFGKGTDYSFESSLVSALDDTIRQFKKEREKRNEADWAEARDMKVYNEESGTI